MFSKTTTRKQHIVTNIDVPRNKFKVWLRCGKYRIPFVSNTISWKQKTRASFESITMFKFSINNSWGKLSEFKEYCKENPTFIFYSWGNRTKIKDMLLKEINNLGNDTELVFVKKPIP